MWFFLLLLAVVAVVTVLSRSKTGAAQGAVSGPSLPVGSEGTPLPECLPVAVKRSFFSRSESVVYGELTAALEGTPYTVFPNVRLNDLFVITDPQQRQSTYNRLRDKHVDFLIVSREGTVPQLAIELDGASHDTEIQKKRDQVKNLVFRSAALTLLRLDARQPQSSARQRELMTEHLPDLRRASGRARNLRPAPVV